MRRDSLVSEKLGVNNMIEMLQYAFRNGIIRIDD